MKIILLYYSYAHTAEAYIYTVPDRYMAPDRILSSQESLKRAQLKASKCKFF